MLVSLILFLKGKYLVLYKGSISLPKQSILSFFVSTFLFLLFLSHILLRQDIALVDLELTMYTWMVSKSQRTNSMSLSLPPKCCNQKHESSNQALLHIHINNICYILYQNLITCYILYNRYLILDIYSTSHISYIYMYVYIKSYIQDILKINFLIN